MSLRDRVRIGVDGVRIRAAIAAGGPAVLVMTGELRARQYVRPLSVYEERGVWVDLKVRGWSAWHIRRYLGWRRRHAGTWVDRGVLGRRSVTTAGVNYMRDDFNAAAGAADITNFKFSGQGTGTNAEAVGDTALQTEVETRDTGAQSGAVSKQYVVTATHTFAGTFAITEQGIFSASSAGTLWDRTVFAAINVVSGDSIQFTYTLTINDGG